LTGRGPETVTYEFDDGGRKAAGWKGKGGDCVTRAIAIASGRPYREVYDRLAEGNATQRTGKRERQAQARTGRKTALHGIFTKRKWFKDYMAELGFEWTATMGIGTGCEVHVRADELPTEGRLVLKLSKHFAAYVDGVLRDTRDSSRHGTRCVYGYYAMKEEA
jgi:hypothetical protein